jgi:short-subunit dehydrogenase
MQEHAKTALITGASAGLGAEFCRQLAARCDVIIAVARRGERLQALAAELSDQVRFHAVEADLVTVEGVARAMEALRQRGPVDILVNNAGFSTFDRFGVSDIAAQYEMVRLHIDAVLGLTRAAIPFMQARGGGAIINVSSVGAFVPLPQVAVYGATKAFLNSFSLALAQDLARDDIRVQALCPGYTRTEIHHTGTMEAFDPKRVPADQWMESPAVVAASLAALDAGGPVLLVPGEANRAAARAGLASQLAALDG